MAALRSVWFDCNTFWNFYCVRHDLSARRTVATDHGQMDRAYSGCNLYFPTTGVSRLERLARCLGQHRGRIPFRRTEWCRPRARLVERDKRAVRSKTQVSRASKTASTHELQPIGIGRRLHVNRSDSRQDFQVRDWKPHRERAPAVGSRARTVAEKFEVGCSGRLRATLILTLRTAKRLKWLILYRSATRLFRTTRAARAGGLPELAPLNRF